MSPFQPYRHPDRGAVLCIVWSSIASLASTHSVRLFTTLQSAGLPCPWGFSRQERWNGLPRPPPGNLPNSGIEPRSPILQADSLPSESPGKPSLYALGAPQPKCDTPRSLQTLPTVPFRAKSAAVGNQCPGDLLACPKNQMTESK